MTRFDLARAARTDDDRYWIERAHSADIRDAVEAARDDVWPLAKCAAFAAIQAELSTYQVDAFDPRPARQVQLQDLYVAWMTDLKDAYALALAAVEDRTDPRFDADYVEDADEHCPPPAMPSVEAFQPRARREDRAPLHGRTKRDPAVPSDLHAIVCALVDGDDKAFASVVVGKPVASFDRDLTVDERHRVADAALAFAA